jgi:hypothetical protein
MRSFFGKLALLAGVAVVPLSSMANVVVWESGNSKIDTTNYTGLGESFWFANFGNPNPVVGATTDSFEARNLPSWIRLETRHAFIGKDDTGVGTDATPRTGYSFVENSSGTAGGDTVGGQPNFNTLTLPNGVSGVSGQVREIQQGLNNTSTQAFLRILPGAPSSFRLWVVTDNGAGANFSSDRRIRVNLRNTTGPPLYPDSGSAVEAEALPGGGAIGSGLLPAANNGTADAWSFLLSGIDTNDIVSIRPTSSAVTGSYASFAGIVIQTVPEPSSVLMLATIVGIGGGWQAVRIRRKKSAGL